MYGILGAARAATRVMQGPMKTMGRSIGADATKDSHSHLTRPIEDLKSILHARRYGLPAPDCAKHYSGDTVALQKQLDQRHADLKSARQKAADSASAERMYWSTFFGG